jgi:hypothetical protein
VRIVYKSVDGLPVAVRVVDRHGVVVGVRMTPKEGALLHQVRRSKGNKRAIEEDWPPEWRDEVKDIVAPRRIFLDDFTDEAIITYCKKGEHNVEIRVDVLRHWVAVYKILGTTQELTL